MPKARLHRGFMERNGIRACIEDRSYFGPENTAVMHFHHEKWQYYDDCVYPEVCATKCNTRLEDYCVPPNAEYEIVKTDGEVIVRIFAKEMPDRPVLEWVFPDPASATENIYRDFVN